MDKKLALEKGTFELCRFACVRVCHSEDAMGADPEFWLIQGSGLYLSCGKELCHDRVC